jgi:hypothetical protein
MAGPVTYRVHENAVLSYRGEVDDLVWSVLQTTRELGKLYAPKRSGRLATSIRASRPKASGVYQFSGTCSASIGYALYVHDGVPGRIYPKRGKYLTVPHVQGALSGAQLKAVGGSGKAKLYFLARSVRGQRSQPFLADALGDAIRRTDVLSYRVS